jgi:hypothetical protein
VQRDVVINQAGQVAEPGPRQAALPRRRTPPWPTESRVVQDGVELVIVDAVRGAERVQEAARTARFGLLLALLLVLLGVSAAVAPGAGAGYSGQHRASVIGESASAAPSMHDDLSDWLRPSVVARHALATTPPHTWGVVRARATGGCALRGRLLVGEIVGTGMAAAEPTPQSSRAPPFA